MITFCFDPDTDTVIGVARGGDDNEVLPVKLQPLPTLERVQDILVPLVHWIITNIMANLVNIIGTDRQIKEPHANFFQTSDYLHQQKIAQNEFFDILLLDDILWQFKMARNDLTNRYFWVLIWLVGIDCNAVTIFLSIFLICPFPPLALNH